MPIDHYALAANHDVALNSLVNIETITPPGDTYSFRAPQARGWGVPGQDADTLDGYGFKRGYPWVDWLLVMTWLQYDYSRSTWTPTSVRDGYTGPVTIYSTLGGIAFARYNAILKIPGMDVVDGKFYGFRQIPFRFRRLIKLA